MRKLSKKQKQILDREFQQGARDVDAIRGGVWDELEAVNGYETLYQDAARYISDKLLAYSKRGGCLVA